MIYPLHGFSLVLTFADLDALRPPMTSVSVAGTSTIIKPSTARSTATVSAGFSERAALWAHHLIGGGDGQCARAEWCGDFRGHYC